jgi:hypothetical protein
MRELVPTVTNPEVVVLMNDLADDYDKLAERAVIRANGKKPAIERQAAVGRCRSKRPIDCVMPNIGYSDQRSA